MSPKRVGYRPWTEEERARLEALAARNTICNNKVCWSAVARDFPGRTARQLKSYYWNVVRAAETAPAADQQARKELETAVPEVSPKPITDLSTDEEITLLFRYLTSGRDENAT